MLIAQPIGRMGTPEEIASLVAFLCSDEATFITDSAYDIDVHPPKRMLARLYRGERTRIGRGLKALFSNLG